MMYKALALSVMHAWRFRMMSAKQNIHRPRKRRAFDLLQSISTGAKNPRAPNEGFLGQT